MIGFQNPFPVRMPNPIRAFGGGRMNPDTLKLKDDEIRIVFRRHPNRSRTPAFSRNTHKLPLLADVTCLDDALAHFYEFNIKGRGIRQKLKTQERLKNEARLLKCGKGSAVYLAAFMAGVNVAGGSHSIYLISKKGRKGSLLIPTNAFQSYEITEFEIGDEGDWPELPVLGESPTKWKMPKT